MSACRKNRITGRDQKLSVSESQSASNNSRPDVDLLPCLITRNPVGWLLQSICEYRSGAIEDGFIDHLAIDLDHGTAAFIDGSYYPMGPIDVFRRRSKTRIDAIDLTGMNAQLCRKTAVASMLDILCQHRLVLQGDCNPVDRSHIVNSLAVEAIESGQDRITDAAVERCEPAFDAEAVFA